MLYLNILHKLYIYIALNVILWQCWNGLSRLAVWFRRSNAISNSVGYLMPKPSLWKNSRDIIYPIVGLDKRVHAFLKYIIPKANVIAYFKVVIHPIPENSAENKFNWHCLQIVCHQRLHLLSSCSNGTAEQCFDFDFWNPEIVTRTHMKKGSVSRN